MTHIHQLTFGPFAENTYILSDDYSNAIIIDPGMYYPQENIKFFEYLNSHGLNPIRLILTHAHLDHVFGVNWVYQNYNVVPELHADDLMIYNSAVSVAQQYGLPMKPLVKANSTLTHGQSFQFGGADFKIFHTPGHSPGSVCFHNEKEGYVIGGDVLFQGSIGRTDLPGGDFDILIRSIDTHLLVLDDSTVVYSGHGPLTTIGQERIANPFLQT
ncbi:MBL fold metallo-hydrolase [Bacteroidia bacterium]|nr:MBL fold metallo-hydrolase [Bacteroidia bacterium]